MYIRSVMRQRILQESVCSALRRVPYRTWELDRDRCWGPCHSVQVSKKKVRRVETADWP
jgi:hypothetical protein